MRAGIVAGLACCFWVSVAGAQTSALLQPATALGPIAVPNPEWLRKPSYNQLSAVFPYNAKYNGLGAIECLVTPQGVLHDCRITVDQPAGFGFGRGVLALSSQFIMKPAMRNGRPVEARTKVVVQFKTNGDKQREYREPLINVLSDVDWLQTPTVSDILAELDKKSGAKSADPDGAILIQCGLDTKSGRLSNCASVYESPGMEEFAPAARALAAKFLADPSSLARLPNNTRANLVFHFPDMRAPAWTLRYLSKPHWIRAISPDSDKATFPEAAAKAGLKTGAAVVDCIASPKGALSQCQVVRESVSGLGFGQMAQEIAQVFVANPWSDGVPVDGAHVRMPIQMDYTPPISTTPPEAPAPTPATKP